jgi:hypothetical protein
MFFHFFCYSPIHNTYLPTPLSKFIYLLLIYLPTSLTYLLTHLSITHLLTHLLTIYLCIYLPTYYRPTHPTLLLHPHNIKKKNNVQKKLIIFIGVNDDEKMLKFNIFYYHRCEW